MTNNEQSQIQHVQLSDPPLEDSSDHDADAPNRKLDSPPPPSMSRAADNRVQFSEPASAPGDASNHDASQKRVASPPPDHHVHFPVPVLAESAETRNQQQRKLDSPPPDPHHVHFPVPQLEETASQCEERQRKLESPPPDPHHVHFPVPPLESSTSEESTRRKLESPPPDPHHVHFPNPPLADTPSTTNEKRKLDSPPPPHHVHFPKPALEDTGPDTPRRKIESPPPPEHHHVQLGQPVPEDTPNHDVPHLSGESSPREHRIQFGKPAPEDTSDHDTPRQRFPSPPPEQHVQFGEPAPEDTSNHDVPRRRVDSPPPEQHVQFGEPAPEDTSNHDVPRRRVDSPPPEQHVHFQKPVPEDTSNHDTPHMRVPSPPPPPEHHVQFGKPAPEDTSDHDTPHMRVPSPPPPPEHHVQFGKPAPEDVFNHDTQHRRIVSPPPEQHVKFGEPVPEDTSDHNPPHGRIESPPPEQHLKLPEPALENEFDLYSSSPKKLGSVLSQEKTSVSRDMPVLGVTHSDTIVSTAERSTLLTKPARDDTSKHDSSQRKLTSLPPSATISPPRTANPKQSSTSYLLTSSTRSTSSTTSKFSSKDLRGNLMRQQKNRDPVQFYEITAILGFGSMGSVARVRKRVSAVGGSARKSVQHRVKRERQVHACFHLPLVGGIFQFCLKGRADAMLERESRHCADAGSIVSVESDVNLIYAMKSIHLSRVTDETFVEELKNEIEILRSLDHPHIVKAIETYEHRNQIFVIMELCSGGDLYSRDPYTEEEAARIVCSILGAISYMHSKGILHRDLKYENIMFASEDSHAEIKLIDFGLSRKFGNEELTDGVGTIYTMAPEVLKGKYTKQADIWSIGVIAYMLMSSQMPFYGRKRSHIVEQIMSGTYAFKGRRWKRVSRQGKAFVEDLLVVDPDDRTTCEEAMRASWLNRRFGATVRDPHTEELDAAKNSMLKFANYGKLRKVALMVVAHKSTSTEIGILRKVFQQYDKNSVGYLSYDEFKAAISEVGYSEEDYLRIFEAMDLDGTGKIRYTEFLAATIEAQGAISEEKMAEAFDRLDSDDSGYISAENLCEILGDEFNKAEIKEIIAEAEGEGGKISYDEFLALCKGKREAERLDAITEISMLKSKQDSDRSIGMMSNLSADDSTSFALSRSNFVDGKHLSERKIRFVDEATTVPPEP